MTDKLTIAAYRCNTGGHQITLSRTDDNRHGIAYRLAGPKHHNLGTKELVSSELEESDAAELRRMLDAVFPLTTPLTEDQFHAITTAQLGDYLGYGWTQEYVEADGEEAAYYRVTTPDGVVVATLPDWAGGVALFLAEAHDAVPALLAEVASLRADRNRFRAAWNNARSRAQSHAADLAYTAELGGQAIKAEAQAVRDLEAEVEKLRTAWREVHEALIQGQSPSTVMDLMDRHERAQTA